MRVRNVKEDDYERKWEMNVMWEERGREEKGRDEENAEKKRIERRCTRRKNDREQNYVMEERNDGR